MPRMSTTICGVRAACKPLNQTLGTLVVYYKMQWAIAQLASCVASLAWCTVHDVDSKIRDYGHIYLPRISPMIPHALTYCLVGCSALWGNNIRAVFTQVYAPAMFIKATLMPLTILPDANPQCKVWHPMHCLTRNDMLPSGHTILALSAALTLPTPWLAVAGATGVTLVASRMHFSVDVILSCWIVMLLNNASQE
jgi:hypothetical protein